MIQCLSEGHLTRKSPHRLLAVLVVQEGNHLPVAA